MSFWNDKNISAAYRLAKTGTSDSGIAAQSQSKTTTMIRFPPAPQYPTRFPATLSEDDTTTFREVSPTSHRDHDDNHTNDHLMGQNKNQGSPSSNACNGSGIRSLLASPEHQAYPQSPQSPPRDRGSPKQHSPRTCYNCGSPSHLAKNCTLPWKPDGRSPYKQQVDH